MTRRNVIALACVFLPTTVYAQSAPAACSTPNATAASALVCEGVAHLESGDLERAVQLLTRGSAAASDTALKVQALEALDQAYTRLKNLPLRETTLRELVALLPGELDPLYRLAAVQEDQNLWDAAEQTLQWARQQHETETEVFRRLSAFYARRAAAVSAERAPLPEPDEQGAYRVGGRLAAPKRVSGTRVPPLPAAASAAGVRGPISVEFTVTETGTVSDVRVLYSIPLLDDVAVRTIRGWRFEPAMLDGRAVPVRLSTTLTFE